LRQTLVLAGHALHAILRRLLPKGATSPALEMQITIHKGTNMSFRSILYILLACVAPAGPVRAANWVVFDEKEFMPICYDRDGIVSDNQGFTHFNWRFKHKSCTDEMAVSTEYESAIKCTRDMMSGDINGFSRQRGPQVPKELETFDDDTFRRGTGSWRVALAICGN
jgi:hypothetical protein